LIPLALRQIYGHQETQRFWTAIGDRKVDYNPKFALYLLTDSLSVAGSTNSLFRVVNLAPSFGGISAQLLRHIIDVKRPELEREKEKLETGARRLQQQLADFENQLLEK